MPSAVRGTPIVKPPAVTGLVVFDLDRGLISGPGPSRLLAARLGRGHALAELERRQSWAELAGARALMARALRTAPRASLHSALAGARFAPGARRAIELLQRHGVVCAAASLSWEFAVESLAARLGIEHCLGTGLDARGAIVHVWPEDKLEYRTRLAQQLGVAPERALLVSTLAEPLSSFARALVARWD